MSNKKITMLKLKRILQLLAAGVSQREISNKVGISRSSIAAYKDRADLSGKSYQDLLLLSDSDVASLLQPTDYRPGKDARYNVLEPLLQEYSGDITQNRSTYECLWVEYLKLNPEGYGYTRFKAYIQDYIKSHHYSYHNVYAPGFEMQVDFAGDKLKLIDHKTGLITEVVVLCCILPYCDKTKLESGLLMLQRALKNKFKAKYILADSWFSRIEFIKGIRKISKNQVHYLGIGRMDSTRYITEGVGWKANQIISRHSRKRKRINKEYKSEYFIVNCVNHDCPVKLIFIRNLGSDKWCFLLTTDMDLSFQRAYELYNIRWSIEVLFKECKQYFKLGRCQAEYLSEQIADCTIALITHTLVSLENRFANYETLGGLYTEIDSQIALMTLWKRILKLIVTLMRILATIISEPIMEVVRRIIIRNHSEIKLLFQMIKTELLKDPDFDNFNPIYC